MDVVAFVVGYLKFPGSTELAAWRARSIDPQSYEDWPEGVPLFASPSPAPTVGALLDLVSAERDADAGFFELVAQGDQLEVRGLLAGEDRVIGWTAALATAVREAAREGAEGRIAIAIPVLGGAVDLNLSPEDEDEPSEVEVGPLQQLLADEDFARATIELQTWMAEKKRVPSHRRAPYRDAAARFFLDAAVTEVEKDAITKASALTDAQLEAALSDPRTHTPGLQPVRDFAPTVASLRAAFAEGSPLARVAAPVVYAHADGAGAEPLGHALAKSSNRSLVRAGHTALSHAPTETAFDALLDAVLGPDEQWYLAVDAVGQSKFPGASAKLAARLASDEVRFSIAGLDAEAKPARLARADRLLQCAAARRDPELLPALFAMFDDARMWWLMPGIVKALAQTGGPGVEARGQELQLAMMGMGKALNSDWARRAELLGIADAKDSGGIIRVSDLDAAKVAQLFEEGFLHPESNQNDSPTAAVFLHLLEEWPMLRARGYAVSPKRPDVRVSLDGIGGDVSGLPEERAAQLRAQLSELGQNANEVELEGDEVSLWWT